MISKVGSRTNASCQITCPVKNKLVALLFHLNVSSHAERDSIDPKRAVEVLLDANEEARKHSFYMLGSFDISPDHNRLAYAEDTTGKFSG